MNWPRRWTSSAAKWTWAMDDPGRRASRGLFETAYTKSPYRFTVIGYPDIFNELKPEDIRGYYTREIRAEQRLLRRHGRRPERRGGGADQNGLREIKGARDAADGFAGGTEADSGARNRGGSAHRAGSSAFRVAHPRTASSRCAGAGRAGGVARQRTQFAAVPAGAREAGLGASRGCVDLQPRQSRPLRRQRDCGRGQVHAGARRDSRRNREDQIHFSFVQ